LGTRQKFTAPILALNLAVLAAALNTASLAMDFSVQPLPDGLHVVFADGEIVAGDATRLRIALQSADRDTFGNKEIALNSGGGLVNEAFAMVALLDQEKVATIVPPGASCASACAQILFLAGIQRMVLDGGRLGMHSCSTGENHLRDDLCNERIAENALEHGTAYGSVMAFMRYVGPSKVIWFSSRQADCYGLTRWPLSFNRGIQAGDIAPCVRRALENFNAPPSK